MPLDFVDTGWLLGHDCRVFGHFPTFENPEDGAEYMMRLADEVTANVLPFFQRHGSLEGYYEWCRRINAETHDGMGDPHILFRQAVTATLLDLPDEAMSALDTVQQMAAHDPIRPKWLQTIGRQARTLMGDLKNDPLDAKNTLLKGVAEQRRLRNLPTPPA